jgi:DNA-binding transcriptional MerR regulator
MNPGIRTNAAAELLGVSANTLRSWERRFGYPQPKRSPGNHRQYELLELQTLRDALAETGNISSAIELARQRQSEPATQSGLEAAFESFDEAAADRAMEESLALRSLERTVEELLLPTLDTVESDDDREAELEFACRWATGWLHGARRLASTASRPAGILLLEIGTDQDLCLRRAGFRVLALSSELEDQRLARAMQALEPTAVVICGPGGDPDLASNLLRTIRELGVQAPLYGFRVAGIASDDRIFCADVPSEVTQELNSDLRRRAARAFA